MVATQVSALESISDREMSEVNGQAFITVDTSAYQNYDFTKVNLGLDIDIMANADVLKIGTLDRVWDEDGTVADVEVFYDSNDARVVYYLNQNGDRMLNANGTAMTADQIRAAGLQSQVKIKDADIHIDNFALGRIEDPYGPTPTVKPFQIKDPYIEFAYDVDRATGEKTIAGVRIGAAYMRGDLSGDIQSLTGVFSGFITGKGVIAFQNACGGNAWESTDCFLLSFAQSATLFTQIDLVDGATGYGAGTEAHDEVYPYADVSYLKRASWAGVPNGRNFEASDSALAGVIPALTVAENCDVMGVVACFPLSIYQTVYIGTEDDGNPDPSIEDYGAKGAFISLQSQTVPWEDLSGVSGAGRIVTDRGAYLNAATYQDPLTGTEKYPLTLDLYDALTGTRRVATCVGQLKGC